MGKNLVLDEARRLYALGFAIHWLRPKSKIPVESGWTTGPRKKWNELERSYRPNFNVGVRLGEPSRIGKRYLAVVDLDIKSKNPKRRREAFSAVKGILGGRDLPTVLSGRGNGSRHFYFLSRRPFKTYNPAFSERTVRAYIPSKKPSRLELEMLSPEEIQKGIRLSRAWEISLYSEGRQVVLPPSVHPDSGEEYRWSRPFRKDLPVITDLPENADSTASNETTSQSRIIRLDAFKVAPVELAWLPISDTVLKGITEGEGVTDRSGFLMKASSALFSAGLSQNEVLTILTDPKTFLGACGYDHAKTNSRRRAAEWVYRYTVKRVSEEHGDAKVIFTIGNAPSRKLSSKEMEKQAVEFGAERNWRQDIERTQQGFPVKTIKNIVHVITHSVSASVIKHDEFAIRDTYSCVTPWGGKKEASVSDNDVARIKYWLSCEFHFEPSTNTVSDSLIVLAQENAYDPVKDFLNALPEWDGVTRLDDWLVKNFEARGDEDYLAQVFRKWMVAMVMRVYRPGAKFDWMPIFEGAQGIGKSSFGRILVGDKYFLDWLPNLNDKDSALSLQGMWAVEMGELSQFRRNELENIKAFLTRTVDKLRPPYGKRLIESPRRCVFFGTTNRNTYLIDETGNRRFKPVVVGNLNFKELRKERLQLFAEAKALWITKKETETSLELAGDARNFEQKIHQEKMVEDDSHSMEESMRNFIEKIEQKEVQFNLQKFKLTDLFEGVSPLGHWSKNRRNEMLAAKMLKRLGGIDRHIKGRKYWKLPENDDFY